MTLDLELKRGLGTKTELSTISPLYIDGVMTCLILEDTDRGLDSSMSLDQLNKLKVFGKTAIPYGRYKIVVTKSERFSKLAGHDVYLPLLLKVPAFEGVRCHSGNKPEDTEGCLLPGLTKTVNFVSKSKDAFNIVNEKINGALKLGHDVYITISR